MSLRAKRRTGIRQMRITKRRYINLLFILLIILGLLSHNVQAQSQQTDSNPSMTIPDMQWIELNLVGTPPNGLRDYAVGYINSNNKLVIFGGTTQGGAKSGATYLLDFNQMSWVPPNPPSTANTTTPGARSNMVYGIDVYSSYRQQLVITTGLGNDGQPFNDTWAFDMNYESWRQITNVQTPNGPVPSMYDAVGGTDLEAQGGISTNNSMWVTLGTDGTNKYQDTWRLVLDGVSSPNVNQLTASWYKLTTSGNIPSAKLDAAGTVLSGGRIAMFGGCNTLTPNCATRDAYVESIQNYKDPTPTSAQPSWLNANQCPGPRKGAAMTMNYNRANPAFENQVILFGGEGTSQSGNGEQGEVNVLDVSAGTWVRVLPKPDPKSAKQYPSLRAGAQMLALPKAVYKGDGIPDGTDVFLFGGEALDGSGDMLSDVWLLRLSNTPIKRDSSGGTKFLQCDVGDGTGTDNTSSGSDGNNGSTTSTGVILSTISFVLLPLAISILRFGMASMGGLAAILYGFTIISSYVTAFLGFVRSKTEEYSTTHRILDIIILILLYAIVPLASIISWGIRRKYESNSSATHIEDTRAKAKTEGFIPRMAALFRFSDSTDYTKATEKSFQVDRRESNGRNTNTYSRDDDNWFDKRKSVSISDTPTVQNDGSSRDSLNNGMRYHGSAAASTAHPNSFVLRTRHAHHIFSQLILLLGAIYVAFSLSNENSVKKFWVALFIIYMGVIYVIWIAAAWRGYPRGRRSLLVAFLGKYCHGNGEFDDNEEEYNNDHELVDSWVNNNTQLRHMRDEEELDEEAQAQMEEEMANREVVVMTIPKRRLTVVNV